MPVILKNHKIAYFPVPKVACSSIKNMLYFLEHGQWYEPERKNGTLQNIHYVYPSNSFRSRYGVTLKRYHKVALVRDPVDRLASAFGNRVVFHQQAAHWKIRKQGQEPVLPPFPKPSEFVNRLDEYRKYVPDIRHHTDPHTSFLGHDLGFFDAVFKFEDIQKFVTHIEGLTGISLELPRRQTGGPSDVKDRLSQSDIAVIRQFYVDDYKLLSGLYD